MHSQTPLWSVFPPWRNTHTQREQNWKNLNKIIPKYSLISDWMNNKVEQQHKNGTSIKSLLIDKDSWMVLFNDKMNINTRRHWAFFHFSSCRNWLWGGLFHNLSLKCRSLSEPQWCTFISKILTQIKTDLREWLWCFALRHALGKTCQQPFFPTDEFTLLHFKIKLSYQIRLSDSN